MSVEDEEEEMDKELLKQFEEAQAAMTEVKSLLQRERTENERRKDQDASTISSLEAKVREQEVLIDELRRRIQAIKEAMERDGRTSVLEAVENIMDDVGLGGVMRAKGNQLDKVFERLYRDAMERIERRNRLQQITNHLPGPAEREKMLGLPSDVREHILNQEMHWRSVVDHPVAEVKLPATTWAKRTQPEKKGNVTEASRLTVPRPRWNPEAAATHVPPIASSNRRSHPLRASDAFEPTNKTKIALAAAASMPEFMKVNRLDAKANGSAGLPIRRPTDPTGSARSGLRVLS
jgi:hypothetical protein